MCVCALSLFASLSFYMCFLKPTSFCFANFLLSAFFFPLPQRFFFFSFVFLVSIPLSQLLPCPAQPSNAINARKLRSFYLRSQKQCNCAVWIKTTGCFLSLFVCLVSEIPLKECSFFFQSVLCCCCSSMLLFCRLNLCAAAREFLLALPPPLSLLPPFHHLPLGEALFVCRYLFFFSAKGAF